MMLEFTRHQERAIMDALARWVSGCEPALCCDRDRRFIGLSLAGDRSARPAIYFPPEAAE